MTRTLPPDRADDTADPTAQEMRLTMNLGDPSEARIYYLPHVIAQRMGLFARQGLQVTAMTADGGGDTVAGGQIPSVLDGRADLTIGGPMVVMKFAEEGTHLVNFCAAVRSNPWFVLGRRPQDFRLEDLAGHEVFDIAHIGTAGFIFDAVMEEAGIAARRHHIGRDAGVAGWLAGDLPYAIHHLHAAAEGLATGRVHALADLARPTGGVPWSAYIARPEVIAARRPAFAAFTRAIDQALDWLAMADPAEIARVIGPDLPDLSAPVIATIVRLYRDCGLWPADHRIPAADIARFGALLQASGWLSAPPDARTLVLDLLTETPDA